MIRRIEKTKIMHRVVESNGTLYFGGVIPDATEGGMGDQTREICRKLDQLLAQAGSERAKLLSAQIFITDMNAKEEMNEAWLEWLDDAQLPARATIGVADLGPGVLIEIVVTAAA